jgi:hypothetical protein
VGKTGLDQAREKKALVNTICGKRIFKFFRLLSYDAA